MSTGFSPLLCDSVADECNVWCVLVKWSCIHANHGQEDSPLIEIVGGEIWTVTFTANGEYIVGGGQGDEVGVWRVEDGKQMATMAASLVYCLAVSKDGR